jgi:T4-like virus tail tube protein gp19
MSKRGERPYAQFDFLIALGDGDPESEPVAGFRECSNVGMEVTVAEYRRAGSREAAARALEKHGEAGEATLKDGMLRQSVLRAWLRDQASAEHGRTALGLASHGGRCRAAAHVQAHGRPDHHARLGAFQRQGHRRHDGGADARLRAHRGGVLSPNAEPADHSAHHDAELPDPACRTYSPRNRCAEHGSEGGLARTCRFQRGAAALPS